MAGQNDPADDLIAELAKLMAQDAQGDRPAAPATPVRIPGGDNTPPVNPAPRFEAERQAPRPAAPAPQQPPVAATPPRIPEPKAEVAPEPFDFDFELLSPKREAGAMSPMPAVSSETVVPMSHDSIADLIAAELTGEPNPAPAPRAEPPVARSEPPVARTEPPVARIEIPAVPVVTRPAPDLRAEPKAEWAAPAAPATPQRVDPSFAAPASPQPVETPAAKAEGDRFGFPPVFGLGSGRPEAEVAPVVDEPVMPPAPEPVAPRPNPADAFLRPMTRKEPEPVVEPDDGVGSDPIDDIESLIGRAMRVELDTPPAPAVEPRPAPSPALRSLATPTIPAQPAPAASPSARGLSGADEAIMAAAQATGAHVGWVDAPETDDEMPTPVVSRRPKLPRAPGISRAIAGPAVAITLLAAAGFGIYWMLGQGGESGPAPLLTADQSPIKEVPEAQTEAPSQSVVFNEIDGVVPGAEEQLVSRDQADVNEVIQVPPTSALSEEGLANRKVRTVTVRPDGTIVSGDDSVAGSTILPVARPTVPEVPGAADAVSELIAAAPPVAETPAATPAPAEPAAPTVVPVTPGSTVPVVDLAGNPVAGKTAPVPLQRPANLPTVAAPTSPVNAVSNAPAGGNLLLPPPPTNSALAAPAPAVTAPVAAPVEVDALPNNAPAYVQLASQRTEEEARRSAQNMVARFGPLFGGANMEVQRVDLGERGIYYRVRVPANSRQEANTICNNVKNAGGDCVIM